MKVVRLEKTDSTNSYAKNHIEEFADKTVICSKVQTSGRGRLNRKGIDLGEGNLFMSIVLKPSEKIEPFYQNITQYMSVVLCKVLESYDIAAQNKWPNDVLVNNKKIAGILSETVMQGTKLQGIVLGLGVNLRASKQDVDSIEGRIVTSLNLEGVDTDCDSFMNILLFEFWAGYEKFLNTGFEYIKEEYLKRNCFLEKELNIQVLNEIKSGIAKSINEKGELVMQSKENKENYVLTIGDIL